MEWKEDDHRDRLQRSRRKSVFFLLNLSNWIVHPVFPQSSSKIWNETFDRHTFHLLKLYVFWFVYKRCIASYFHFEHSYTYMKGICCTRDIFLTVIPWKSTWKSLETIYLFKENYLFPKEKRIQTRSSRKGRLIKKIKKANVQMFPS